VKNPNYWQGWEGNHLERIELQLIREASTNKQMLQQGDLDVCENILLEDWKELDQVEGITVYIPENKVWTLIFTLCVTIPPTDNLHIRRAMMFSFDYEKMRDEITEGYGIIPGSLVPPAVPGHNPNVPKQRKDLGKAKEEMILAGYPTGKADPPLPCKALVPLGDIFRKNAALQAQSDWRDIGIDLEIIEEPSSASWEKYRADDFDYNFNVLGKYGEPEADGYLYMSLHSTATPAISAGWNQGNISDPYLDFLLDSQRAEVNPVKREELLWDAQQYIYDQAYYIVTTQTSEFFCRARRSWLKSDELGFFYNPGYWRIMWFYGLYKEGTPGQG
jgi:peptide/nickel transport system substrate-binding protein